jgi:oligoendopeptidase F
MSSQTWNLSPLLQSDTDPLIQSEQKEISQAIDNFVTKWKPRTDYLENARALAEALHEYNNLMATFGTSGKAGYYFSLRITQDQTDTTIKAQSQKITDFSIAQSNKIQFFEIRLSQIKQEIQEKLLRAPELSEFKHYLERIFIMQPHILSEPEERILNLKSQTSFSKWVRMTSSLLSKETCSLTVDGQTSELSFEELLKISSLHPDEKTRDTATAHINDIMEKLADVAENEINAILQDKKVNDELRGYTRPDQARHLSDDIDTSVVDAMLATVTSRYDLSHKFYALKAKILGKNKLKYNERNLEIGEIKGTYQWEESVQLIDKVFKALDPQFSHILNSMLQNGQFDIFPRKGKKGGAFCANNLITHPTYVLLNHTNKLNDVLTLAHEMGHAINNEFLKLTQNALNYDTPLSTAEVASTFMEDFVLQELEKSADAQTKKALLMQKLNDDISTIFRQVACYKFEQSLHTAFRTKGYLSKDEIGELFQKNMSEYMGNAVEQPDWARNWWIYWSHIRSFFYVYSYASGLLISKAMQNMVKQNPREIEKVKTFLSAGTSDSPKNIFAKMDIDITNAEFWNLGLNEIEKSLQAAENLI